MPERMLIFLKGYGAKIHFERDSLIHTSRLEASTGSYLCCGKKIRIGEGVSILLESMTQCDIGCNVTIANNSELVLAERAKTTIGNNCNFGRNNRIIANRYHTIEIGEDFLSAVDCVFRAGDGHTLFDVSTGGKKNFVIDNYEQNTLKIGNHIWVGMRVCCMSPTRIGSGSNIGAYSVVKGIYPNNCVICGSIGKVIRENSAWARSNNCEDMENACGILYSIPTIHINDDQRYIINHVDDFFEYCNCLSHIRECIIIVSVKDTSGFKLKQKEMESLRQINVETDLENKHWRGYVFISDDHRKKQEILGEIDESVECTEHIGNLLLHIESKPLHAGNTSLALIDGKNYSTNARGLNFVVWDKIGNKLIDSCCFDTHLQGIPCTRKVYFT